MDRFSRALRGTEKGETRALHRARIASRRLRELIPMLQLDADVSRKLARRLRRVTRRLGAIRELDVLLLLMDELEASGPANRDALSRVRAAVSKERDAARKRLVHRLPIDDMARLARKLDRLVATLRKKESAASAQRAARAWRWAMDARLARRAARAAAAIESAGGVYLPDRLHDVRISLKKFRYATELAADAAGSPKSAVISDMKRLQLLLGRMHDVQVLIDRVRDVQASLAPPDVAAWREFDRLIAALDERCRRLHARYVREREHLLAAASKIASRAIAPAPRTQRRVG